MLSTMRNAQSFDNTTVKRAIDALRARLPARWIVTPQAREPCGEQYRPDAMLEVRAPDGSKASIVVETKQDLTAVTAAALAPRLEQAVRENKAAGALVVTRYLTPLARERLKAGGISYLDLTGNTRIVLDRPALFIEASGADRDPAPQGRASRSLKGGSAARIVRALCDWNPPVGVRELARRAEVDPGYASRILTLLQNEDVVSRNKNGAVAGVKWKDLLRRWAQDYAVMRTNQAFVYLEPRSIDALLERLAKYNGKWALTGSRAMPRSAAIAGARNVSCYVETPDEAAADLGLRAVDAGANVVLLEAFDSVIWDRTRIDGGLTSVAVSQCAVDLLTGTGREPSEGEALLSWMEKNERVWRA